MNRRHRSEGDLSAAAANHDAGGSSDTAGADAGHDSAPTRTHHSRQRGEGHGGTVDRRPLFRASADDLHSLAHRYDHHTRHDATAHSARHRHHRSHHAQHHHVDDSSSRRRHRSSPRSGGGSLATDGFDHVGGGFYASHSDGDELGSGDSYEGDGDDYDDMAGAGGSAGGAFEREIFGSSIYRARTGGGSMSSGANSNFNSHTHYPPVSSSNSHHRERHSAGASVTSPNAPGSSAAAAGGGGGGGGGAVVSPTSAGDAYFPESDAAALYAQSGNPLNIWRHEAGVLRQLFDFASGSSGGSQHHHHHHQGQPNSHAPSAPSSAAPSSFYARPTPHQHQRGHSGELTAGGGAGSASGASLEPATATAVVSPTLSPVAYAYAAGASQTTSPTSHLVPSWSSVEATTAAAGGAGDGHGAHPHSQSHRQQQPQQQPRRRQDGTIHLMRRTRGAPGEQLHPLPALYSFESPVDPTAPSAFPAAAAAAARDPEAAHAAAGTTHMKSADSYDAEGGRLEDELLEELPLPAGTTTTTTSAAGAPAEPPASASSTGGVPEGVAAGGGGAGDTCESASTTAPAARPSAPVKRVAFASTTPTTTASTPLTLNSPASRTRAVQDAYIPVGCPTTSGAGGKELDDDEKNSDNGSGGGDEHYGDSGSDTNDRRRRRRPRCRRRRNGGGGYGDGGGGVGEGEGGFVKAGLAGSRGAFRSRNMNALYAFSWDQRTFLPKSHGRFAGAFQLIASPRFLEKIDWALRGSLLTIVPAMMLVLEDRTRHLFPLPGSAVAFAYWITQPTLGAGLRELFIVVKGFAVSVAVMFFVIFAQPSSKSAVLCLLFLGLVTLSFLAEDMRRTCAFCLAALCMQYISDPRSVTYGYALSYLTTLLLALCVGFAAFLVPYIRWSSDVAVHYHLVLGDSISLSVRGLCRCFWVRSPTERQLHTLRLRQLSATITACLAKVDSAISECGYEPHSGAYQAQLTTRYNFFCGVFNVVQSMTLLVERMTGDPSLADTPLCRDMGRAMRAEVAAVGAAMDAILLRIARVEAAPLHNGKNGLLNYYKSGGGARRQAASLDETEEGVDACFLAFRAATRRFQEKLVLARGRFILNNPHYVPSQSDILLGFFFFSIEELCDNINRFGEDPSPRGSLRYMATFAARDLASTAEACVALYRSVRYRHTITRRLKEALRLSIAMIVAAAFQTWVVTAKGSSAVSGAELIAFMYRATDGESFTYASNRLLGTVLGSLVALMSVQAAGGRRWVLYVLTGVLTAAGGYVTTSPTAGSLGSAINGSVISIVVQYQNQAAAMIRIQQNCFAIFMYFAVSSLLWPVRGRQKVRLGLDLSLRMCRESACRLLSHLDVGCATAGAVQGDVLQLLTEMEDRIHVQSKNTSGAETEPTLDSAEFPMMHWTRAIAVQRKMLALLLMMRHAYYSFMSSHLQTTNQPGASSSGGFASPSPVPRGFEHLEAEEDNDNASNNAASVSGEAGNSGGGTDAEFSVHWVLLRRLTPHARELSALIHAAFDIYIVALVRSSFVPTAHLARIRQGMHECYRRIVDVFLSTMTREIADVGGSDAGSGAASEAGYEQLAGDTQKSADADDATAAAATDKGSTTAAPTPLPDSRHASPPPPVTNRSFGFLTYKLSDDEKQFLRDYVGNESFIRQNLSGGKRNNNTNNNSSFVPRMSDNVTRNNTFAGAGGGGGGGPSGNASIVIGGAGSHSNSNNNVGANNTPPLVREVGISNASIVVSNKSFLGPADLAEKKRLYQQQQKLKIQKLQQMHKDDGSGSGGAQEMTELLRTYSSDLDAAGKTLRLTQEQHQQQQQQQPRRESLLRTTPHSPSAATSVTTATNNTGTVSNSNNNNDNNNNNNNSSDVRAAPGRATASAFVSAAAPQEPTYEVDSSGDSDSSDGANENVMTNKNTASMGSNPAKNAGGAEGSSSASQVLPHPLLQQQQQRQQQLQQLPLSTTPPPLQNTSVVLTRSFISSMGSSAPQATAAAALLRQQQQQQQQQQIRSSSSHGADQTVPAAPATADTPPVPGASTAATLSTSVVRREPHRLENFSFFQPLQSLGRSPLGGAALAAGGYSNGSFLSAAGGGRGLAGGVPSRVSSPPVPPGIGGSSLPFGAGTVHSSGGGARRRAEAFLSTLNDGRVSAFDFDNDDGDGDDYESGGDDLLNDSDDDAVGDLLSVPENRLLAAASPAVRPAVASPPPPPPPSSSSAAAAAGRRASAVATRSHIPGGDGGGFTPAAAAAAAATATAATSVLKTSEKRRQDEGPAMTTEEEAEVLHSPLRRSQNGSPSSFSSAPATIGTAGAAAHRGRHRYSHHDAASGSVSSAGSVDKSNTNTDSNSNNRGRAGSQADTPAAGLGGARGADGSGESWNEQAWQSSSPPGGFSPDVGYFSALDQFNPNLNGGRTTWIDNNNNNNNNTGSVGNGSALNPQLTHAFGRDGGAASYMPFLGDERTAGNSGSNPYVNEESGAFGGGEEEEEGGNACDGFITNNMALDLQQFRQYLEGSYSLSNKDVHSIEAFLFGLQSFIHQSGKLERALLEIIYSSELARKL